MQPDRRHALPTSPLFTDIEEQEVSIPDQLQGRHYETRTPRSRRFAFLLGMIILAGSGMAVAASPLI